MDLYMDEDLMEFQDADPAGAGSASWTNLWTSTWMRTLWNSKMPIQHQLIQHPLIQHQLTQPPQLIQLLTQLQLMEPPKKKVETVSSSDSSLPVLSLPSPVDATGKRERMPHLKVDKRKASFSEQLDATRLHSRITKLFKFDLIIS